jgi:hypothetical protein
MSDSKRSESSIADARNLVGIAVTIPVAQPVPTVSPDTSCAWQWMNAALAHWQRQRAERRRNNDAGEDGSGYGDP